MFKQFILLVICTINSKSNMLAEENYILMRKGMKDMMPVELINDNYSPY